MRAMGKGDARWSNGVGGEEQGPLVRTAPHEQAKGSVPAQGEGRWNFPTI